MDDGTTHQIIECEIRLHDAAPPGGDPASADAAAWEESAVGAPALFRALADPHAGRWNGPLAPGVDVAPPRAVADPWWTVRLAGSHGVPIMVGRVGHPLEVGEPFQLPSVDAQRWQGGVVFDGTIVEG